MRSARYRHQIIVLLLAAGIGSGCTSGDSRDLVSDGRPRPAPAETYPDFSQPLDSAMAQMSDEDAARQERQLSALAQQRRTGAISPAEYRRRVDELRLLGQQANQ